MARIDEIRDARNVKMKEAARRYAQRREMREAARVRAALDGPARADSAERVQAFREMTARRAAAEATRRLSPQERMIGPTLDFDKRPPDSDAELAGQPVARIVEIDGPRYQPYGFGTGFMVTPRLLLTNHHVLPHARTAVNVGAQFGYEYDVRGLRQGEIFELEPDALYQSSQ
jgi:endonuclease G, mitochondrial